MMICPNLPNIEFGTGFAGMYAIGHLLPRSTQD